jgi:hypothetical protein
MDRRLAVLLGLAMAWPIAADAVAAEVGFRGCGTRNEVADWLDRTFGEKPFASGIQGDGRLFELFAASRGQTWTVVVTDPDGESCIMTEGTQLELAPPGPVGPVA